LHGQVHVRGIRRGWRYGLPLLAVGIGLAWVLSLGSQPADSQTVLDDPHAGLEEWRRIESVLTHPRCLNCHTMTDHPTQGDDRRAHALLVKRGDDGGGAGLRCRACHGPANHSSTGIPGAADWRMPPLAMAWETGPGVPASGAAICESLKRTEDDGLLDYEKLIETVQFAPFVLWAWEPGMRRDGSERPKPPMRHETFVDAVKRWISAGAPCPQPTPQPPATGAVIPSPQ
jgi:hypothetical protein